MVELKHYRVKGMRRGIRHSSEEFGVRTKILKGGNAARKEREKRTKSYKTASKEYMKTANKIAKKYRSEFTISLMKDLSVRNIQKGAGITNEPVLTSRKISDVFAGYGYDEEN